MSTRSAIAYKTPEGFCGVYHHRDGYPSGLGCHLFGLLRLPSFSSPPHPPGVTVPSAHSLENVKQALNEIIERHPCGWSSLSALLAYYDGPDEVPSVTQSNASDCGCEYAYVFDPEKIWVMEIWSSYCGPGEFEGQKMIGGFGCGDPTATWRPVATVDLREQTPDWTLLDKLAEGMES